MTKKTVQIENEEVNEDSAALDTLKPGSRSVSDPKSKPEVIRNALGAMHAMTSDELTRWWTSALEQSKQMGNGQGIPDGNAAHNASTIVTHPSASSHVKEGVKEDLANILSEQEGLSEEFKTRATTLFEAALESRLTLEIVRLEEEFDVKLLEETEQTIDEITEALDNYLDYAATEWLKENEVAIESALRNEISQDFMNGLRNLFIENNISVPEDQVDIVDTLADKVEDLEGKLNDAIVENVNLRAMVEEGQKQEIVQSVSEGLTLVQSEKLKELTENIDYDDLEEFQTKVATIKDSSFVKNPKKSLITEGLEEVDEENQPSEEKTFTDPNIRRFHQAITRSVSK